MEDCRVVVDLVFETDVCVPVFDVVGRVEGEDVLVVIELVGVEDEPVVLDVVDADDVLDVVEVDDVLDVDVDDVEVSELEELVVEELVVDKLVVEDDEPMVPHVSTM